MNHQLRLLQQCYPSHIVKRVELVTPKLGRADSTGHSHSNAVDLPITRTSPSREQKLCYSYTPVRV